MEINEEKTQFGVHDPYNSDCSYAPVWARLLSVLLAAGVCNTISLHGSAIIMFK